MKLRIKGNSIRLRLAKTEVDQLNNEGVLVEKTTFSTSTLTYTIKATAEQSIWAGFENNQLTVYVPLPLITKWANNNEVGLKKNLPAGNGETLSILIEKDFKCLDAPAHEDQSDFFDNPAKTC